MSHLWVFYSYSDTKILNIGTIWKSIRIIRVPKKTTYREGEMFNKEGMLVKACYNDNIDVLA